ncbi:TIR domain-containing protein, partial [Escherichia coli]|uniref:TIR domain-containing protein n=1 Tax=Escherichia coli TaxID=562 RepID=UPI00159BDB07|nr:toll/interleukin-1 receptor domain-containing protein [Escherichia coli]
LQHTELQTFFDANDIAPGHKFALEIFNSIEHSALVVVRTDAYASREWCRREVIEAKRRARPIVVIDALTKAEERGFPYLGNVPA